MSKAKPLVVLIPPDDREALRNAGVLPPSWFRDADAPGWEDGGPAVRLWTGTPDLDMAAVAVEQQGEPPLPALLLGLSGPGRSMFADENLVAKLFDSVLLHVVFLDGRNGDASDAGRGAADSWVGVEPILRTVNWAKAFNQSVEYWFSDEQARNIRHVILAVARGGREGTFVARVRLAPEQDKLLNAEFSEGGTVQVCYFIDGRLEVELDREALHARFLWPVLAGRLLLRLLVALSSNPEGDDVFRPGVHLWRSFEFLFDYPVQDMTDMVTKALDEAFRKLGEQTDASSVPDGKSVASAKPRISARNEEAKTFPGLATSLSAFKPHAGQGEPPDEKAWGWRRFFRRTTRREIQAGSTPSQLAAPKSWNQYPATREAEKRNNDEQYWGTQLAMARRDFARIERELFQTGQAGDAFSPEGVFPDVARDPRNVSVQLQRLEENGHPTDTIHPEDVYRKWKRVVDTEKERLLAKAHLADSAKELLLAQKHYVTPGYGAFVAVAVSLVCGITLVLSILSLGGNGAWPMAVSFAGLSTLGAFAACLIVREIHGRAGRKAVRRFQEEALAVDGKMDARHAAAADTVRMAESKHRDSLRFAAWQALCDLLERVWRMLAHELQSPTLSAFYRTEEKTPEKEAPSANDGEAHRQRESFRRQTRFSETIRRNPFHLGRRENSDRVLERAFGAPADDKEDETSFLGFWRKMCEKADRQSRGNLPATILVPEIRRWLESLCNRLCAAQKADLLADRGTKGMVPSDLCVIHSETGFPLATAHVDKKHNPSDSATVFVFEKTGGEDNSQPGRTAADQARTLLEGTFGTVPVVATSLLNGLPQIAVYFQDLLLCGLGRSPDGRLVFLSRKPSSNVKENPR